MSALSCALYSVALGEILIKERKKIGKRFKYSVVAVGDRHIRVIGRLPIRTVKQCWSIAFADKELLPLGKYLLKSVKINKLQRYAYISACAINELARNLRCYTGIGIGYEFLGASALGIKRKPFKE